MANLNENVVPLEDILFDPNNFRFQDKEGFIYAAEDRFHENPVQENTYQRLKRDEAILPLKDSIIENKFIPVERVVVVSYEHSQDKKWLIIEGNRRVAAARWALEDYDAGVGIPQEVLDSLNPLPVLVVDDGADEEFISTLMGIRHISGIKNWGGYQRAKLIVQMRDDLDLSPQDVAARVGLSVQEVTRRYRAFSALEQMKGSEDYGDYATPSMYPIFHEAVSVAVVKDWLTWSEADMLFADEDNLEQFYSLICPFSNEEQEEQTPKITSHKQVRELRNIIPNSAAKRTLLDYHKDFEEAVAIIKREEIARMWIDDVTSTITSLEEIGLRELKTIQSDDLELLQSLQELVQELLSDFERLREE